MSYLPNAAKLQPLGFKAVGFDPYGQRVYRALGCEQIAVDAAEGASETVTLSIGGRRLFTGPVPDEAAFDALVKQHFPELITPPTREQTNAALHEMAQVATTQFNLNADGSPELE